jgi:dienelactone hydrolase
MHRAPIRRAVAWAALAAVSAARAPAQRAGAAGAGAARAAPAGTPPAAAAYHEERVGFGSVRGVRLAGTLTIPRGPGPFPVVILLPGSGPHDRNGGTRRRAPLRLVADHLAQRGVAALRYDKRGVGRSTGDFFASTAADFAVDAEAALRFVQARPEVARGRVGLLGHSEGGLVAPMVAARSADVAFLVLLAAPGLPGDSALLLQRAAIDRAAGAPPARDRALDVNRRLFAAMRAARDSAEMAARLRAVQRELASALPPATGRAERDRLRLELDGRRRELLGPYWRHFLLYDPRPALRALRVPVLALTGTLDVQVPHEAHLAEIAAALRAAGNTDYRAAAVPGLNHLFQRAATGSPAEYDRLTEDFAPAALALVGDWIAARTGSGR